MKSLPAVLALFWLALAAPAGAAEADVLAAWKRHEIDFTYMGFTTRYSCEGLRDKMRVLLRAAGARPDFDVSVRACAGMPGGVTEFPRVRLVFFAPELPEPGSREVGEPAPSRWVPVRLARRQPRDLEIGDCELVEQFRDRVLTAFTSRNLQHDINCIPHQLSGSSFDVRVEVLKGLPPPDRPTDAR